VGAVPRLGAVIPFSLFTIGAGVGHVREMITAANFAPGNAGVAFYTGFGVPAFGLLLLWLQSRYGPPADTRSGHRSGAQ
jgi:hypothetical protein